MLLHAISSDGRCWTSMSVWLDIMFMNTLRLLPKSTIGKPHLSSLWYLLLYTSNKSMNANSHSKYINAVLPVIKYVKFAQLIHFVNSGHQMSLNYQVRPHNHLEVVAQIGPHQLAHVVISHHFTSPIFNENLKVKDLNLKFEISNFHSNLFHLPFPSAPPPPHQ